MSNSLHILPTIYESSDDQDNESVEINEDDDVFEDHTSEPVSFEHHYIYVYLCILCIFMYI